MKGPLGSNPNTKRSVFLVPDWHETMFVSSFKCDQFCKLKIPFVILNIPNKPYIAQQILSILSNCVVCMIVPLLIDPQPEGLVMLVPSWNDTIPILLFIIEQFCILQIPSLFQLRHVSKLVLWFGLFRFGYDSARVLLLLYNIQLVKVGKKSAEYEQALASQFSSGPLTDYR